jgi:hypothetical protein
MESYRAGPADSCPTCRCDHVLPRLFQQVWIPGAAGELRHARTPERLIDDRAGVQAARAQGLTVTATLGVLVEAAARLIEIEEALERLGQTKFRRTQDLFAQTVKLARARRECHE